MFENIYELIISPENLFCAWEIFKRGKRNRLDVGAFEWNLEENIFKLHRELRSKTYRHASYRGFWVRDPKMRRIHKATVRDRVLHHAVFRILNIIFEPTFIPSSFSCRIGKGTHKGIRKVAKMLRTVSKNNTCSCHVLKCDVKKFFDSIDQRLLVHILEKRIKDENARWLLREIIESYPNVVNERERERERENTAPRKKGVPIGNLTSQLFANVYMNEFDQYVKHILRVQYYARYTDDFVIIADSQEYLLKLLPLLQAFLKKRLGLRIHPDKVFIRSYHQGIDFLGYGMLPHHIVLRTKTKRRMLRKLRERAEEYALGGITEKTLRATLQSYLGVISHANTRRLRDDVLNEFWF